MTLLADERDPRETKIKSKKFKAVAWFLASLGGGTKMSIKIKYVRTRDIKVAVAVCRPTWQQFLMY